MGVLHGTNRGAHLYIESMWRFIDACDARQAALPVALRTRVAIVFGPLCRLVRTNTPDADVSARVTLGTDACARHSAHHRQLPHVCEGVGDGTLMIAKLFRVVVAARAAAKFDSGDLEVGF